MVKLVQLYKAVEKFIFAIKSMGLMTGIKNFGSKILGGISSASKWLPSTLHKILGG
jgi:hypothetical protein